MRSQFLVPSFTLRPSESPPFVVGGRRGRGPLVSIRTGLAAAAAIAVLALIAREAPRPAVEPAPIRAVPPAALVAPAPLWTAIPEPKPHYAVDLPQLKSLPQIHEARRHANGGREDKLVYGVFESEQPYLRLAVFRGPHEAERPASFFLDLARRAGEAGLAVVRSGLAATVPTKLGALETAEVVLSDAFERPCLAFRLRHDETGVAAHGWYCAPAEPRAAFEPACLVDRLAALPAAGDAALKAAFARADRRRNPGCDPRPAPRRKAG